MILLLPTQKLSAQENSLYILASKSNVTKGFSIPLKYISHDNSSVLLVSEYYWGALLAPYNKLEHRFQTPAFPFLVIVSMVLEQKNS